MTSTWSVAFSVMIAAAIANIQAKYYIQFVYWFFTGFKVGVNNKEKKKLICAGLMVHPGFVTHAPVVE